MPMHYGQYGHGTFGSIAGPPRIGTGGGGTGGGGAGTGGGGETAESCAARGGVWVTLEDGTGRCSDPPTNGGGNGGGGTGGGGTGGGGTTAAQADATVADLIANRPMFTRNPNVAAGAVPVPTLERLNVPGVNIPTLQQHGLADVAATPLQDFDVGSVMPGRDPSYQHRFDEAMRAVGGRQAAMGLARGGAAANALQRAAQQFASREYGAAHDRGLRRAGFARDTALARHGMAERGWERGLRGATFDRDTALGQYRMGAEDWERGFRGAGFDRDTALGQYRLGAEERGFQYGVGADNFARALSGFQANIPPWQAALNALMTRWTVLKQLEGGAQTAAGG